MDIGNTVIVVTAIWRVIVKFFLVYFVFAVIYTTSDSVAVVIAAASDTVAQPALS